MTFDQYWQALEASGWLAEVSPEESQRLRAVLAVRFTDAGGSQPDDTWLWLAVTSFDPECIEYDDHDAESPYVSIIEQLAARSFGRFAPEDLADAEVKGRRQRRISFRFNGSEWVVRVPCADDWFQDKVLELLNTALRYAEVDQQFMVLPRVDQRAFIAFISPQTYARAVELGVIPADEHIE